MNVTVYVTGTVYVVADAQQLRQLLREAGEAGASDLLPPLPADELPAMAPTSATQQERPAPCPPLPDLEPEEPHRPKPGSVARGARPVLNERQRELLLLVAHRTAGGHPMTSARLAAGATTWTGGRQIGQMARALVSTGYLEVDASAAYSLSPKGRAVADSLLDEARHD